MGSHFVARTAENGGAVRAKIVSVITIMGVVAFGCSPTGALTAMPIEGIDDRIAAPSGELEVTDALGLAYMISATRAFFVGVAASSAELPGLNRSPLFDHDEVVQCRTEEPDGFSIDYDCLPEKEGRLRIFAESGFANENGDYRLQLDALSVEEGLTLDATARMRVEGIANPTKVEKTIIAPVGFVDGLPDRFRAVENTAIVVDNTRGSEKVTCVTIILGETYAWTLTDSRRDGELDYSIRDKRNIWECTSQIDGASILGSECRTPVGQGDFAVLKF